MKIFIPNKKAEDIENTELHSSLIKGDKETIDKLEHDKDIMLYKQSYILIKGMPKTIVKNVF